MYKNLRNKN